MWYLLAHGLLCVVHLCGFHLRKGWHYCCNTAVSVRSAMRGENIGDSCYSCCIRQERTLLRLPCQPGERLCRVGLCQPGRNKPVFTFYSSWLSFQALSLHLAYPGSANRMISETIGIVSRIHSAEGEHETPLDGGSQCPPYSMWYHVGTILSAWLPVKHWEVVDGPNSFEKALQVTSSHSPNKAAETAAGTMRWIFLTALKVIMDGTLCDATPVATCRDAWKN